MDISKASENYRIYEEYFNSYFIRKAFIVGNDYKDSDIELNGSNDATHFAKALIDHCGFKKKYGPGSGYETLNDNNYGNWVDTKPVLEDNVVVLINTKKLDDIFKDYIKTFSLYETIIEFIFYFSGHGVIVDGEGMKIKLEDKQPLLIDELVEVIEAKEKAVSDYYHEHIVNATVTYRKLFIFDCCRRYEDSSSNSPSYPYKEYKNTAFLYSCNLGNRTMDVKIQSIYDRFNNSNRLGYLTSSLINRIKSKDAPGRSLYKAVSIIQKDLEDIYKELENYYKKLKPTSDKGCTSVNFMLGELQKINNNKFKILFGDVTVAQFVFVNDPLSKDIQIKQLKEEVQRLQSIIDKFNNNNNQDSNNNNHNRNNNNHNSNNNNNNHIQE